MVVILKNVGFCLIYMYRYVMSEHEALMHRAIFRDPVTGVN